MYMLILSALIVDPPPHPRVISVDRLILLMQQMYDLTIFNITVDKFQHF